MSRKDERLACLECVALVGVRRVCNSNVLVVIRSVDFFRAIFVGFVRASFRFSAAHLVARFACAFLFAAHLYRFKRERTRKEGAVEAVVNRIGE